MRADLTQFEPPRLVGVTKLPTKADVLTDYLTAANKAADRGNEAAHKGLLEFACLLVKELRPYRVLQKLFDQLHSALIADGYELAEDSLGSPVLLPTEPSATPLPQEITALEAELNKRGYDIALNHYHQAVDNLVAHRYESANGALRSALEDLVTRLAVDHESYQLRLGSSGLPKDGQGGDAITHLINANKPPLEDGGMMLRGLWKMCATNGPHPGRSSGDDARARIQLVTAAARLLLGHFPI